MSLIQPRTLKGFRDYLPAAMMSREWIIDAARRVYRSYGFRPIDTPALEYLEILTGKGSDETDKQLYRFQDHGGRDVGLRFDLTVPLARFVAQHQQELGLPFKRYHIGAVWRGENTQTGRYRAIHAVRLRHDRRHRLDGRRRDGAGDQRSVPRPGNRGVLDSRQPPRRAERHARKARPGRALGGRAPRARQAAEDRPRGSRRGACPHGGDRAGRGGAAARHGVAHRDQRGDSP